MANRQTVERRSDLDIKRDIDHLESRYPPLVNDRHQVKFDVKDGHVRIKGYLKAIPTYDFIVDQVPLVRGVQSVNVDELYVDEEIRHDVGHLIPYGVYANVEYGSVILSGRLPENVNVEDLVREVGMVEGVHRVVTSFM